MGFLNFFSSKKSEVRPNAKTSAPKVTHSSFFELPLPDDVFRRMIFYVEEKELRSKLPDLSSKKILEVSPKQKSFATILKERNPKVMARISGQLSQEKTSEVVLSEQVIVSHWETLPLLEGSVDFILLRTSLIKASLGRLLREASRVLKPQGGLIVSDLHPFSHMVQKDYVKSPAVEEGGPGIERYFKWFRDAGLHLDGVKEFFFDSNTRKFFETESQKKAFESYKKTPLLIMFSLRKE